MALEKINTFISLRWCPDVLFCKTQYVKHIDLLLTFRLWACINVGLLCTSEVELGKLTRLRCFIPIWFYMTWDARQIQILLVFALIKISTSDLTSEMKLGKIFKFRIIVLAYTVILRDARCRAKWLFSDLQTSGIEKFRPPTMHKNGTRKNCCNPFERKNL